MRVLPASVGGRVMLVTAAALAIQVVAAAAVVAAIILARPEADASAAASTAMAAVIVAGIVAAVLALPVALFTARSVTHPLARLRDRVDRGVFSSAGWPAGEGPAEVTHLTASIRAFAASAAQRSDNAESQRDRFATLLTEMADAVLIVADEDRIDLANPAASRLFGMVEVTGRRLAEVVRDHEILEVVEQARRTGAATQQIERSDPRRYVRVVARRLPGADVLVTAQDLTALRRLETVRSDFVANVSHELRTPIASIKAMVETLEGGALGDPPAASDFLGRIHREIDDVAQLVTELLTLTRIESGTDALDRRPTDPAALVRAAVDRMRALAERAGVGLSAPVATGLPAVAADPERIGTVFSNLIHNAVKATPSGGAVTVTAQRDDDAVAFLVRDTGSGIARDELDRIFERFYKSDSSRSREGTGLGLAIAKHIVLAHGGTISADSDGPGRGATFRFTLPTARA